MRCSSATFLLSSFAMMLVLLLHVLPGFVEGGWPAKMDKKDRARMQDILSGRMAIPANMGLFVKYRNKKGRKLAKRWAKRQKFRKHIKKLKVVSIVANNRTALEVLSSSKDIVYVELQHRVHALPHHHEANSKIEQAQKARRRLQETVGYGVKMIQADQLWDLPPPQEENKTTVCVVDSGYALGHPDLPNSTQNVKGMSTVNEDWFQDGFGHGTHCAGVIGAIGNNDVGVAGVIKDPDRFNFYIAKSLDRNGDGSEVDVVEAVESCVDAGAKVISLSLGGESYSETVQAAYKKAYNEGVLFVAAAGNDGITDYNYPASLPQVMSVAAVNIDTKAAPFSQYNDQVEIAAPGVDIVSTSAEDDGKSFAYSSWSGTSMSTPFVAGTAAILWSYFPDCTNNEIRNVLLRTAKHPNNVGCSEELGFGIVQAKGAYDLLVAQGCRAEGDSFVAVGGCRQDPSYVPPPTPAPTAFTCKGNVFRFVLKTDKWGQETSWDLKDSNGKEMGSGDEYRNIRQYVKRLCLPDDEYTFTIRDKGGDGICCKYGEGHFSIKYNGVLIKEGGRFWEEEVITIPQTVGGLTDGCYNSNSWTFTTPKGKKKDCQYVAALPSKRCEVEGIDKYGNFSTGFDSCPVACGSCDASSSPAGQVSGKETDSVRNLTPSPTPSPTSAHTEFPLSQPTFSSIPAPTPLPTPAPPSPPSPPSPSPSTCCPSGYTAMRALNGCTEFYHCVNGVVTGAPQPCPPGTLFSETAQYCDWPNQVTCGPESCSNIPPPPTPVPTPSPPTPTPTPPSPSPSMCCPSGHTGLRAYNGCTEFYHCVHGVVTGTPIPCAAGTLFDQTLQNCNWANQVTCIIPSCNQRKLLRG